MSEFQTSPPAPLHETRPFRWSVRRELWENRWIYLAPVAVVGFVLFAYSFYTLGLPKHLRQMAAQGPAKQHELIVMPFSAVAGLVMMASFLIGFFYCLEAFQGERRDRSILFWKSLPISDRTVVLSKASIPLLVMPLLMFAIVVIAQTVMLQLSTVRLLSDRWALSLVWTHLKFGQTVIAELYGLIVLALWHAPIYAWLLLVSAWARRVAILWAVLPFLVIFAAEHIAFGTHSFANLIGYRFIGWFQEAFYFPPKGSSMVFEPFQQLTVARLLSAPGLWLGLIFAAAFLVLAVRLRRAEGMA
jgi:ABC-2 type transport system permease protein